MERVQSTDATPTHSAREEAIKEGESITVSQAPTWSQETSTQAQERPQTSSRINC